MEPYEIQVTGAKVIYTNEKEKPYNPLRRPKIGYRRMILTLSLYLVLTAALAVAGAYLFPCLVLWVCLGFTLLYGSLIAKRAIIWLVHLYQNKASDRTRLKCVFEPSCSEYMILSVEKYGVLRGVYRGIRRLLRCHPPNGGRDEP